MGDAVVDFVVRMPGVLLLGVRLLHLETERVKKKHVSVQFLRFVQVKIKTSGRRWRSRRPDPDAHG